MINFEYLSDENIFHVIRTGSISVSELLDYQQRMHERCKDMDAVYILDDSRKATTPFTYNEDITPLTEGLVEKLKTYRKVSHAIIMNNPHDAVITNLYKILVDDFPNYNLKIFSTERAALQWLKIEQI